jgi:2-polyprenyl-3-methyl-5-hydroxy-6-metoxy-1,4-benzoquinol methylase
MVAMKPGWRLPTRIDADEWLDQGAGAPAAVEQSLADLHRINRWLGGLHSFTDHLYPRLRNSHTGPISVLDLGAGGCTVPIALAQWARGERLPLRVIALDRRYPHLQWAQKNIQNWPEISLLQADALSPPLAEGAVDIVISSLFLHHFTERELTELLPRWVHLARRSLVMSDLVRHPLPYWFMKAASPIFARSPITQHDAAISIRRAYRPRELHAIARQAGLHDAKIFTHFPYRMTLVIDHPR